MFLHGKIQSNKISELIENKDYHSCLEIGLGTSPYFARKLGKLFNKYLIVEKRVTNESLPKGIELINKSWESFESQEKFDVILASHVIYYFEDLKKVIAKMINSLTENGRIFFVVNGKTSDCGKIKLAFAEMINTRCFISYIKKAFSFFIFLKKPDNPLLLSYMPDK